MFIESIDGVEVCELCQNEPSPFVGASWREERRCYLYLIVGGCVSVRGCVSVIGCVSRSVSQSVGHVAAPPARTPLRKLRLKGRREVVCLCT